MKHTVDISPRTCFTRYAFDISESDMLALADYEGWHGENICKSETLDYDLATLRANDVEWNGHFGPSIFYSVDDEDDYPGLHNNIRSVIIRHIEKAYKETK